MHQFPGEIGKIDKVLNRSTHMLKATSPLGRSSHPQYDVRLSSAPMLTRLVWNSVKSTLRAPSKRSDAVMDDTTCARRRFRFV